MDDPRRFLDQISAGYQNAIILLTANHLGLFTALESGPRTAEELARDLGCARRALDLLLCALVAADVLEQPIPGRFGLRTALAPYLLAGGAETMHSILDHHYYLLSQWVQLATVVRTGQPAADTAESTGDRALQAFICGMKNLASRDSLEVAAALPQLGACKRLLDLGGGPGTGAITFCRRWEHLSAVVFDLPTVVPIARAEIAANGLTGRITTRAGDYEKDPLVAADEPPFDAVYISHIIHSLDPQKTFALLTKAIAVLAPGGWLVLKDFFLEESRTNPPFAARFAINMLVATEGGKSYTWRETEEMCRNLNLTDITRHTSAAHWGILTARRPNPAERSVAP